MLMLLLRRRGSHFSNKRTISFSSDRRPEREQERSSQRARWAAAMQSLSSIAISSLPASYSKLPQKSCARANEMSTQIWMLLVGLDQRTHRAVRLLAHRSAAILMRAIQPTPDRCGTAMRQIRMLHPRPTPHTALKPSVRLSRSPWVQPVVVMRASAHGDESQPEPPMPSKGRRRKRNREAEGGEL